MLIKEMTRGMCIEMLTNAHFGHIACTTALQPYITPFSFRYEKEFIYCFGTLGKKIEMMRANPLICVEVENITSRQEWKTIIIQGRYEELPDSQKFHDEINTDHDLLAQSAAWWEPGYARTIKSSGERPIEFIWFRVSVAEISGHQAIPDTPPVEKVSMLRKAKHNLSEYLRAWATALDMS
jgi:nitroimidazol reductase NimA-like FMN-containing flavoprotein (pyridoxamine 5'-phosphate oxidase superfamily)